MVHCKRAGLAGLNDREGMLGEINAIVREIGECNETLYAILFYPLEPIDGRTASATVPSAAFPSWIFFHALSAMMA